MCGIIGYLGNENAFNFIYLGLELLQNRGYDSAGIITIDNDEFNNSKFASHENNFALSQLISKKDLHIGSIGLGHTRWATHGAKTNNNAHPHVDCFNQVAIVHNGIIENYIELKNKLLKNNYTFKGESDSEIICNLISYYMNNNKDIDDEKVIQMALDDLDGTWAILIILVKDPNTIYLSKNGSPLVFGYDSNFLVISSEQLPLSVYFSNYVTLEDGDFITVKKNNNNIIIPSNLKSKKIENKVYDISPSPFIHWTLKEIHDQKYSINNAINNGGRILSNSKVKLGGLDENSSLLKNTKHIVISGCGTSFNAGLIGGEIFKKLKCAETVTCIDASDFNIDDLPNSDNITFIVLSQSGETKDVHRCMELIKNKNIPIISIVNVVGSVISKSSTCGVYLNAGREVGVASTKSFTSQIIVLSLIAIWFAQNKNVSELIRIDYLLSIRKLSLQIDGILNNYNDKIKSIAELLKDKENTFILGKGEFYFLAKEIALKVKELTYIHAEGYTAGGLKHGPFALISDQSIIFLLAPKDSNFNKLINTAEEIKSRNGNIILITNEVQINKPSLFKEIIFLPYNSKFNVIIFAIILQLVSYQISILKNINPDYPRNLAKVVTVDG